jgi:hypothetical protein
MIYYHTLFSASVSCFNCWLNTSEWGGVTHGTTLKITEMFHYSKFERGVFRRKGDKLNRCFHLQEYNFIKNIISTRGCWLVLSPTRKETSYSDQTRIYSTYSPRSSIHFLSLCSKLCKPLNKIQNIFRPTRPPRHQWPPCRTKNGDISIVFVSSGNRSYSDGAKSGE